MKLKIFKPILLLIVLLTLTRPGFAQETPAPPGTPETSDIVDKAVNKSINILNLKLDLDMKPLVMTMNSISKSLNLSLNNIDKNLDIIGPEISASFIDMGKNLSLNLCLDGNIEKMVESGEIQEKTKTYSKSYTVDANDKLEINNKYGKVVVNTWNKNEVKVDVQIRVVAKDDETALKMMDAISISDSKEGDVVSFRTNFGGNNENNSIWNLFNNRNDHHKAEVNYTIYMPSKNALDIDNRYGATDLPDFDGKVTINSAYGSFSAKSLTHTGNDIKVRYGSANIENLNSSELSVGYGSLELGSVDKLTGDFHYSSIRIGKIKTSGTIDAHYAGGIQIDNLDKNFTSFSVDASYSSIKVGLNNSANADFDVTVHYGGFDYSGLPVDITQKTPSDSERGFHPTQNYKGHIGKGNGEKVINIHSSYGGVKFE
jgi:hypothetical protein